MHNPYAIYVNCDGAMDYDSNNSGGVGFVITFPESISLESIPVSIGRYQGGNIEQIELEALILALKKTIEVFNEFNNLLKNINTIIFITDRFGLSDSEKTNPYKIKNWRSNGWKNHEGKPIKNKSLLDELDKTRMKLTKSASSRVSIEYRPRKQNKIADKLAKAGKNEGLVNLKLWKRGEKIGKRKFQGPEIKYTVVKEKQEFHINIFRKDPVQEEWEIWAEICEGIYKECKLKIYAPNDLASKLKRGNEYNVKIKSVFFHHVLIYKAIKKKKKETTISPELKSNSLDLI